MRIDRRQISLVVLVLCAVFSLGCAIYPLYLIRPFRSQGARELAIALEVFRWRPLGTIVSAAVAAGAAIVYWRNTVRRRSRAVAAALAGLVCVLALLVRVNVYELMFHPNKTPVFVAAQSAKLDAAERVLAVRIGGQARGYPVRSISYHHVINDEVGNRAIVATY